MPRSPVLGNADYEVSVARRKIARLPRSKNPQRKCGGVVSDVEQGWRLETDSLGGNPVFRNMSSDEVIRPLSANRNTVKALEKRGLIVQGKGGDPLQIVWLLGHGKHKKD